MKAPARLRPFVEAAGRRFNWLMQHWTWPTLFVLSAVPNPFFELAGFSAGSTRIGLGRFLPPTVMGKVLRGFLLAYVGARLTIL